MRQQQYRLLLFLACSVLIWLITFRNAMVFPTGVMDQVASVIMYPVLMFQHRVILPLKTWSADRATKHELAQQVDKLHQENSLLKSHIIHLNACVSYLQETQSLQEFKQQCNLKRAITTQIIARNLTPHEHYVFVDKGAQHGIKADMVAVYHNCLVGRVTQVYPFYSKVVLVTDATCKVAAFCVASKATGIHAGANSLQHSLLQRVDHLSPVNVGDQILSSGEGLIFPQGFSLGSVAAVTTHNLCHEITVTPCFDINKIAYCLLIEKGNY